MGKQDETTTKAPAQISRRQLFALWGTLITVLGTSVVPKIIDAISDRPSIIEVQDMIAAQTKSLTVTANRGIDRLDALTALLNESDKAQSKLLGHVEAMQAVVQRCCTRHVRDAVERLASRTTSKSPKKNPILVLTPPPLLMSSEDSDDEGVDPEEMKSNVTQQQKLPPFDPAWIQRQAVKE